MRKLLLLSMLCVLFGMSSCMETFYVTNYSTYQTEVQTIKSNMEEQGFKSSGLKTDTRNEAVVSGISYSSYTGYGTAMANNYITQDTYSFADSLGNTMSYTVSYQAKQTQEGTPYVVNAALCGCETSNPDDFERLCGEKALIQEYNTLPKDLKVERMNMTNTYLAVIGIALGISSLLTLISLAAY